MCHTRRRIELFEASYGWSFEAISSTAGIGSFWLSLAIRLLHAELPVPGYSWNFLVVWQTACLPTSMKRRKLGKRYQQIIA